MLVARGKAGRVSGLIEQLPDDQKRVHQNDPLAALTEPTTTSSDTTSGDPAGDVAAAIDVETPLLEPTAPPMPGALAAEADATITATEAEPRRRR